MDGCIGSRSLDSLLGEVFTSAQEHLPEADELGPAPPQNWACSLCTFENVPDATNCSVCNGERPEAGTGTVNAGFGISWTEADAASHAYGRQAALQELRGALEASSMPELVDSAASMGYVNVCLGAAIHAVRAAFSGSFASKEEAFCHAIHSLAMAGGDADTNAAVAGALLGCAVGKSALPQHWLQAFGRDADLPHRAWLEDIAECIARAMPL
eukprot:TRINITY_DN97092_c0_g1_i1.p1 TRINITY_DN97092_c0_g1~~TRINITY_DN97092_c0_g1_i1.p1  ORF type:complete len:250 (-),score=54.38 TRINITY_DN97092_c0_g1_i1:54-692(-)